VLAYGVPVGTHRDSRLSFNEWRRYRRLYRALVVSAGRARQPLDRDARRKLKTMARETARRAQ
jgi:hypothetical protein